MQHQWPLGKTKSEEAAEADVAVVSPRRCMQRFWQHFELCPIVRHTVEPEEVDYIADHPDRVIFGGQ